MALSAKLEKAIDEYGLRVCELERAHSASTKSTTITEYRAQEMARAALVEEISALLLDQVKREREQRREIVERFMRVHPELDTRKLLEDLIGRSLAPETISDDPDEPH
jgi:hypothetical protein